MTMRRLLQTDGESDTIQTVTDGQVSFRDNLWTDQYEFHFGEWIKQIVDWVDINLKWLLDAFIWPFRFLFDVLMSEDDAATSIMSLPWYWVAIAFFLIGSIARNTRIGLMAGSLVAACGLLGPDYWGETTKTFGMIFVSVLLCALIGIPLGVLCGRVDSVWNAVRPVLDAMQVVHAFVYMLPFIFFWGIGEPSATMATLVFALPPLVRLTNLGVRQVPGDVVEASRAFGANEFRVLKDVQLPLARPAIMTGLNQTLLMAIGMLGIAAIMGAGGHGKLLLQAINSNNVPQATSSGLAYFFVAIVLDRITQRESADGLGLFGRIREAFSHRKDPEALLEAQAARAATTEAEAVLSAAVAQESNAPIGATERLGLMVGLGALAITAIATFLTWGNDAGLVSSWGRRADETDLGGQSFSGIEASGGSIFGVIVLCLGVLGALSGLRPLLRTASARVPDLMNRVQGIGVTLLLATGLLAWVFNIFNDDFGGWLDGSSGSYNRVWTIIIFVIGVAVGEYISRGLVGRIGTFIAALAGLFIVGLILGSNNLSDVGLVIFALILVAMAIETFVKGSPRLGADGMLISALGAFGVTVGYFLLQPPAITTGYSHGIGVYVALAATAIGVLAGLAAVFTAPYTSRVPLKLAIKWPLILGAVFAVVAMLATLIAPWVTDARIESLITPEMEIQIQELSDAAGDDIGLQIRNAQEITNLINSAQADPFLFNGVESDGPGLGWPTIVFTAAAAFTALLAAGLFGGDETKRWRFGTVTAGLGLAAFAIPAAWIFSFTRSAEPRVVSGNGSFFAMCLAFILFAIGRGVINHFRRRKVYGDFVDARDVKESGATDVTGDVGVLVGGGGA